MSRHTLSIENPLKKILTKISQGDLVISIVCFMLSRARLLTYMTPFGLAFFASSFSFSGWFYAMIAGSIGSIMAHPDAECVRYILTFGITSAILGLADIRKKTTLKAICVSLVYFFVCILMQGGGTFRLYDFIVQSFESFLCFGIVYAIDAVTPVIADYKKRTYLNHNEVMGIIVLVSLLIISLADLPDIFGLAPASFVAIFIIMAISYKGDVLISSVGGIIFGLALSLGTGASAAIAGAFAFAGFAAGLFAGYSRLGIVLGVTLANAIITAFMNDTSNILINPIEVLVAGLIFATLPNKTVDIFSSFAAKACDTSGKSYAQSQKTQYAIEERLLSISEAFGKIADIYKSDCYMRQPGKQYITKLFDYTGERTCSDCNMKFDCWQKNKKNTYAYMTSMLDKASEKGELDMGDLPQSFEQRCIKKNEFVKNFNFVYDIYKTDMLWLKKMHETRQLMVSQMQGISGILEHASKDIRLSTNAEHEQYLMAALDREGKRATRVSVFEKDNEPVRICIELEEEICQEELEEVISDAADTQLVVCKAYKTQNGTCYEMCPCTMYTVQWASLSECKNGESICGDSFVTANLEDGVSIVAISDGMGSGKSAQIQSRDTLMMLECFLGAGFDAKTAFELINSSLLLRSAKDCFSTIDMMSVDTKTGVVKLSKIGAAPSYVKQKNKVKRYDCSSLPVGILRDIEPEVHHFGAGEHTMVVMMSDGISNTVIKNKNDWIEHELHSLNTHNPAVVAEKLMNKAIKTSGGRIEDDMTVAVAVIYKNE